MELKTANKCNAKQTKKLGAKQAGFTLFEILITTVIIAIVASIVIPTLTETKDKNVTVGQEIAMMAATINNIDDRYFDENITTALNNQELIESNILPKAYRRNTAFEIFNLWGGVITIDGVDENGLTWVSSGVPAPVCSKFIDDAKSLGFEEVETDAGGARTTYSTLDNAQITQMCQPAAGTDLVTITWHRTES